jgi:adenylate cyclase
VQRQRGTIDKYIGDAIMAFWGAPLPDADHARHALQTAIAMQKGLRDLDAPFAKRGWPELHIGVGLNCGMMSVGDMGSKFRRSYTVMGDSVNLASRLEGLTKEYGASILISEDTLALLEDPSRFTLRELDHVTPKGKSRRVRINEVLDALDARTRALRLSTHDTFLAGVEAYHAGRIDEAKVAFEQVLDRDPTDAASLSYLERCRSDLSGGTSAGATRGMRPSFAG